MTKNEINLLKERSIKYGERWVYSAGFNVRPDLENTSRIDNELDDIKFLIDNKACISILSHHGNLIDMRFIAERLAEKLNSEVKYSDEKNLEKMKKISKSLNPGELVMFGNTRFYDGEKKNDWNLAEKFSKLGDFVAIGGFSKAHRKHASNVGILNYAPGFLTQNHVREMNFLGPWADKKNCFSIAVLGGIKKEKIITGLELAKKYDVIIPGGIVLNTGLRLIYGEDSIGESVISEDGKTFEKEYMKLFKNKKANCEIYIPHKVISAKKTKFGFSDIGFIDLNMEKVPKNKMIVSYILPEILINRLEKVVSENGRMVLAGTPDLYKQGIGFATNEIVNRLKRVGERGLILGGDTGAEIDYDKEKYKGKVSTGGGASLEFLCTGTTAVYEALKINKRKFG